MNKRLVNLCLYVCVRVCKRWLYTNKGEHTWRLKVNPYTHLCLTDVKVIHCDVNFFYNKKSENLWFLKSTWYFLWLLKWVVFDPMLVFSGPLIIVTLTRFELCFTLSSPVLWLSFSPSVFLSEGWLVLVNDPLLCHSFMPVALASSGTGRASGTSECRGHKESEDEDEEK